MSRTAPVALNERAALIVIDVQRGFDDTEFWGRRNNPVSEENIAALLAHWRHQNWPVVFVQHASADSDSPLHPDHPGHEFQEVITGTPDLLVVKSVNSSFHGSPDLHAWLQQNQIDTAVICGITTNHCCETTARVGGNLGYQVYFALDATHTFDRTSPGGEIIPADLLSEVTATNLHGEFATVVATSDLTGAKAAG